MEIGSALYSYTILEKISSDKTTVTWDAVSTSNPDIHVRVTEFFPASYCTASPDGTVAVSDAYRPQFDQEKTGFVAAVREVQAFQSPYLPNVMQTVEHGNTVFVIWAAPTGRPFTDYLAQMGGKLSCQAAVGIMGPLAAAISALSERNVSFPITTEALYVEEGRLRLCSFFQPGYMAACLIEDISNVLYRTVTGKRYGDTLCRPLETGAALPVALDDLLYRALHDNTGYSSLASFWGDVNKACVPAAPPLPQGGGYLPPPPYAPPNLSAHMPPPNAPKPNKTGLYVGLSVGCGCLILLLIIVVGLFGLMTYVKREGSTQSITESEVLPLPPIYGGPQDGTVDFGSGQPDPNETYDVYEVDETNAFVIYNDETEVLNGMVAEAGGFLYYRMYDGDWSFVKKNLSTGEISLLAAHCMPAFLQLHGSDIYFADGLDDYHIYHIRSDGSGKEMIYDKRSEYLQLDENGRMLYFSDLTDGCRLYALDTSTRQYRQVYDEMSNELILEGANLYFTNGADNFTPWVLHLTSGKAERIAETATEATGLILWNDVLFYYDREDELIKALHVTGEEATLPFAAGGYTVAVANNTLYYADYNDMSVNSVSLSTGEVKSLGGDAQWVCVIGNSIYYMDYYEGECLRRMDLDGGNPEALDKAQRYTDYEEPDGSSGGELQVN